MNLRLSKVLTSNTPIFFAWRRFTRFAVVLLVLGSCSEQQQDSPEVIWEGTPDQLIYAYGDTLRVSFQVSEGASVRYQLLQGDLITSISGELTGKLDNNYQLSFVLNDRYLPSGSYTVRVTAENEGGTKSNFQSFSYQELSREQTGWLLLSANRLTRIDSGGTNFISRALPQRLQASSRSRQFVLWDKQQAQDLYHLDSLQLLNSNSAPVLGQSWLKVLQGGPRFITGQYPRSIASWSNSGQFTFRYNFPDSIEILDLAYHRGALSVVHRETGRRASYLSTFFPGLRGVKREKYLGPGKFHLAGSGSGEGLGLLREHNGSLSMYEYRPENDQLLLRYSRSGGAVKEVKCGPASSLLVLLDQGLFRFPYDDQARGAVLLKQGLLDDFAYHRVSKAVIFLQNQRLQRVSPSGVLSTVRVTDAHSFAIIYNK